MTARPTEQINLTPNARTVLEKRYLRKGPDGKPVETIEQMFERVASAVAYPDKEYGNWLETYEKFYDLLTSLRFFPNSPTFTGAGTPLGQLAACFVLPLDDDMGKEDAGIFQTLRNAALIQQTGGGNGFNFGKLRPKNDYIAASGGIATGPVGFLKVYDKAFGEIFQGGVRRGANMAVMPVNHPDVLEFIKCKAEEGDVSNFNISVALTDEFMLAVKENAAFDLINPRDGSVWQTLQARDLFNEIVKYAHRNGEPGVLFIDTANRDNPVPHLYTLEATNPCSEQWLGPYENCCLGSINLAQHITIVNGARRLNWELLQQTIRESTHFLDNVVSANKYVPAVPQLKEQAEKARRIGLGIMGLADAMWALGIRYGSEQGEEFAGQVMEFVRYHCMLTSIELAAERGSFPATVGSIYDPDNFKWETPTPLKDYTWYFGRPSLSWITLETRLRAYGIRNACQTTIAPTGTIATVAGCEGYGCEPVFALAYTRHVKDPAGGPDLNLEYLSPLFTQALIEARLSQEQRHDIKDYVMLYGSCQNCDMVPRSVRETFIVAEDVSPEQHVRMQAAMQRFVDNSISKTCNLPEDATEEDVAQVYMLAWELGCKGITVYVTGSREEVVLETKATQDVKQAGVTATVVVPPARERQKVLVGKTYRMETPIGTAYITINDLDDQPYEVFVNVGKGGSDIAAVSEALGRLCSLELQTPSTQTGSERAQEIVHKLRGISGSSSVGFGPNRVGSLPDAIAIAMAKHLYPEGDITQPLQLTVDDEPLEMFNGPRDFCPECHQATLVHDSGCAHCTNCGYDKC